MANKVTSILVSNWLPSTLRKLDVAVLTMATEILRDSVILAPKESRALVNSGRIHRQQPAWYKIIFGGGPVPYAKRRHYENKKNPGTLKYLERAGDNISRNVKKYTRGI